MNTEKKFESGDISATKGVNDWKDFDNDKNYFVIDSISNHLDCNWGDIENDCKIANNHAVKQESGLIISYYEYEGQGIFITTDVGHNTRIMLSEEHEKETKAGL